MYRDMHLLAMAQGRPCLLQTEQCRGGGETTVAAHSNQLKHGKGRSLKSHDAYSVWSCAQCHTWLDQGRASRQIKNDAFDEGFERQVAHWQLIVKTPDHPKKDVTSAAAALAFLRIKAGFN